jgi:hypothetical protein
VDGGQQGREPSGVGFGAEPAVPDVASVMAVDDRGIGLRATWRLNHGFVNLSLWRGDRCVETFHLTPSDAATFMTFLVKGLADVASVPAAAPLRVVREGEDAAPSASAAGLRARRSLASALRRLADSIQP